MNLIDFIYTLTDLTEADSVQIELEGLTVWLSKDFIQMAIHDPSLLHYISQRDDLFSQLKQISTSLHEAGKTVEIFYKTTHICTLGKEGHSYLMEVLGIEHMSMGNPLKVYQLLKVWSR
ncbi:MAG: hypothetical protein HXS47_06325 [Theionarchaea archaeon]|nr:hypothetical protein [Theionarchaea archaeon]